MNVFLSSRRERGYPVYDFDIRDAAGNIIWTGSGFAFEASRDAAVKVAMRELAGLPPIINTEAMTPECAGILKVMSKARLRMAA